MHIKRLPPRQHELDNYLPGMVSALKDISDLPDLSDLVDV